MTRTAMWLTVSLLAAGVGLTPARATDYFETDVVNVDYGVETVLNPQGSVVATYDVETVESQTVQLPSGLIVAEFPGLVTQLLSDPQTSFGNIPSWVFTGLTSVEDANGFGINNNALIFPDPAVAAFEAQLAANVGGPFITTANPGFLVPPTPQAYCDYLGGLGFGFLPCQGQTAPVTYDYFAFTYQLGPDAYGGNTYTELVNFNFYYDNVTEQQAVPEPSTWAMMLLGFAGLGYAGYRQRQKFAGAASEP
jgi:PEP-CTERM motif